MSSDSPSGEDKLIARFFGPIATDPGALGLSDDAAFIKPPAGCEMVLKTDAIVGGIHFFTEDPAAAVAQKALRVNLSDLAAKGARPLGFLVSLALPKGVDETWLTGFASGLREDAATYKCPLFGGDTVRSPGPIMVSVATFGSVPDGRMVRRSTAKPGDHVFVSGSIGDAVLGLGLRNGASWSLDDKQREHLLSRYLLPRPRNALAQAVLDYASASMDVSDGLAGDLAKLCRVSKVSADIEVARVPLSDAAKVVIAQDAAQLEPALSGGDDYEILCTVPPANVDRFRVAAMAAKTAVTDIGTIAQGEGARFCRADGTTLNFKRASFSHF
ncbi:thiamine-monophosphate kinase [Pseudolabrys sp. Root1462]|uniref:thiamine-phosphate kinase n=1 Tax=Pseudolabrys sp. Root1462 TaxID=1736466 RepID=UPI000703142D|nr:thiamine-phosphate kinase [Pseudolabrys sp. Root1462]KQZ00835.1 thiamine-monophosphate kinase [Pseudolabrys sp. Root1462]